MHIEQVSAVNKLCEPFNVWKGKHLTQEKKITVKFYSSLWIHSWSEKVIRQDGERGGPSWSPSCSKWMQMATDILLSICWKENYKKKGLGLLSQTLKEDP